MSPVSVFDNLVSFDDLLLVVEKIRQGQAGRLAQRLTRFRAYGRITTAWEHTEAPSRQWVDLEPVRRRLNLLATGNDNTTIYEHVCKNHLAGRSSLRAISIGCGTGAHEMAFARSGLFTRIDAVDLSRNRIDEAREVAAAEKLDAIVDFRVADLRSFEADGEGYDVVFAFNALHHVTPLRPAVRRIAGWLKPGTGHPELVSGSRRNVSNAIPNQVRDDEITSGGLLVLRDYVGPPRFQWTDRQVAAANEILSEIPAELRTRWRSGSTKERVLRPGRLAMKLSDPSEAAESEHILDALSEHLETVELRPLGGSVLHLVLKDIAHNFDPSDSEAADILTGLFEAEDDLLREGELTSDFVFGVFRPQD